jgi:hypothetical protein
MKLTKEEQGILESVEQGEWRRVPNFKRETKRYRDSAGATLRKGKRVKIK